MVEGARRQKNSQLAFLGGIHSLNQTTSPTWCHLMKPGLLSSTPMHIEGKSCCNMDNKSSSSKCTCRPRHLTLPTTAMASELRRKKYVCLAGTGRFGHPQK